MLRGMWDLPGPRLEPMSPALTGGFLTTEPPGKSPFIVDLASPLVGVNVVSGWVQRLNNVIKVPYSLYL